MNDANENLQQEKKPVKVTRKKNYSPMAATLGQQDSDFVIQNQVLGLEQIGMARAKERLSAYLVSGIPPALDDANRPLWDEYVLAVESGTNVSGKKQFQRVDWNIGKLESDQEEFMLLHTREAVMLMRGQSRHEAPQDKESRQKSGIPGVLLGAKYLRELWFRSGNDNPYADHVLTLFERAFNREVESLVQSISGAKTRLESTPGIQFAMLKSSAPARVELSFKSPYGYELARYVANFDIYARVLWSLSRATLIDDEVRRGMMRKHMTEIRRILNFIQQANNFLSIPRFSKVTREDFKSDKSDVKKRIAELNELIPGLNDEILTKTAMPKHARKKTTLKTQARIEDKTANAEPVLE